MGQKRELGRGREVTGQGANGLKKINVFLSVYIRGNACVYVYQCCVDNNNNKPSRLHSKCIYLMLLNVILQ